MPIVVFNATDAVTGRRILFDSLPTPVRKSNISLTSRPYNYRELLSKADDTVDILPMSGARASASFPMYRLSRRFVMVMPSAKQLPLAMAAMLTMKG